MTSQKCLIGILFFILPGLVLAAPKSDLAKEKRWAEQIVPSLIFGEAVKLKAAGVEFLGIYAENNADAVMGGALLVHGMGVHPAWPDIINPLRMNLPEYGWHTLSLQMPILKNEATHKDYPSLFDEVPGRIQAGVDYLKSKGIKNIVIIGHSLGNAMTVYYLTTKRDPAVRAFVAVAFGPGLPSDPRMDSYTNLRKIKIPVLDIYGGNDFAGNLRGVDKRRHEAKKASNKDYTQIKIEGANHFFNNMEDVLIKRIRGWLAKYAPGKEITIQKK